MKTIYEQTGWKRKYPNMICQDINTLLKITEYSYDLTNKNFIKYFISRTCIQLGKEDNPNLAYFLLTSDHATTWLLNSKDYKYANGENVTTKDRHIDVEINKIQCGKLQDCWELFKNNRRDFKE